MAVNETTASDPAAPNRPSPNVEPGAPPRSAAPGATTNVSQMGITDLVTKFNTMATLPLAAKEYLDTVKKGLDQHYGALSITLLRMPEPDSVYAFICEQKAIIMLFAEQLSAPSQPPLAPKSRNIDVAMAALARTHPTVRVINAVMVQPADFDKVGAMIMYIGNNLLMVSSVAKAPIDITNFTEKTQYAVDLNLDAAREFIGRYYPHANLPRMDLGMVIYHRRPRSDQFAREGIIDQDTPIAAIGAYVEMIRQNDPQTGMARFMPLVRITNITSIIPAPAIALIAIALAGEHLCVGDRWMDQFRNFAKRGVNLGNLIVSPDEKKPLQLTTAEGLETFRHQYCMMPMLGIDIVEGQARIPGLTVFQDQAQGLPQITNYVSTFFRTRTQFVTAALTSYSKVEFIGTFGAPPGEDTRNITYLDAVAKGTPPEQVFDLLGWPMVPENRARKVSEIVGGMTSLHMCTTAVIAPSFLVDFGRVLAASGVMLISTSPTPVNAPLLDLASAAQQMRGMPRITNHQGYQSAWPHNTGNYSGMI